MKRLNDGEKQQLGVIIHYYRNQYFHSAIKSAEEYKQINFSKDICSQTQLSRLEHGDVLKDQEIYEALASKLNLDVEKVSQKDFIIFMTYFENILTFQNDDQLIINYNEYIMVINKFQNIFKKNIIYTHYNYALEFIIAILGENLEDANYLVEDVENTLDILPTKLMVLTLHYLGIYYHLINKYNEANKFYLSSIEHMHKYALINPMIYIDIAFNDLNLHKSLYAVDTLNKAIEFFHNTPNYEILERIYQCFGLVHFKQHYYEDGLNYLSKAIEYAEKTGKNKIIAYDYHLVATGLYLLGDYNRAFQAVQNAKSFMSSERGDLLELLIHKKITGDWKPCEFKDHYCQLIMELYLSEDYEAFFESQVIDILNQFSQVGYLIVMHDMVHYYKETKKYKKALELVESTIS